MYEYQKYSELYLVENSFNISHFNTKGANIFTEHLADVVDQKLTELE